MATAPILLPFKSLADKGIPFTRTHVWRLIKAGKFPAAVKVGERRLAWVENEVDAYLAERIAQHRNHAA